MSSFSRILLATDFSDHARAAYSWAAGVATPGRGVVVLVHAPEGDLVAAAPSLAGFIQAEALDLGRYREEFRLGAKRALAAAASEIEALGVTVEPHLLAADGRPSQAIVLAAETLHCDVIVLASHGRGGLAKILIGSTAEKVVRMASCPVLTVPLQDSTAPDSARPRG